MNKQQAEAIQWAINLADSQIKRDARSQEERNYLHDLENLKRRFETREDTRAFNKPTV